MARYELNAEEVEFLTEFCMSMDVNLRPDYSGRSMYGATCIGITTDVRGSAMNTLFHLGVELARQDGFDADQLILELADCRTDSMGLGTIMYWPGVGMSADLAEQVSATFDGYDD